tara:strand:- start:449 stop:709 length:261 start_codon:yes stop_codon:yes gene_type:complete
MMLLNILLSLAVAVVVDMVVVYLVVAVVLEDIVLMFLDRVQGVVRLQNLQLLQLNQALIQLLLVVEGAVLLHQIMVEQEEVTQNLT